MTEELKTQDEVVKNRVTVMEGDNILPAVAGPMEIMADAVNRGMGKDQLEVLERMFEFDLRVKAQQAKEAFFSAMANFHKDKPPLIKDKVNPYFKSKYTSLENMLQTYSPCLAKEGLSLSFPAPTYSEDIMVCYCRITHALGHQETTPAQGPIDKAAIGKQSGKASRTAMQDVKATTTYLRATACEGALGVVGTEATLDIDGNMAGSEPVEAINDSMFTDITSLIQEVGADEKRFCRYMKIASIDKMPADMFENAIKTLEAKKK